MTILHVMGEKNHNNGGNSGLEILAGFEDDQEQDVKTLSEIQDDYIQSILKMQNDNILRAASILGVSPSTLYRWREKKNS